MPNPPSSSPPGSGQPPDDENKGEVDFRTQLARQTVPPQLDSKENRKRWKLEDLPHGRGPYLVELNIFYVKGMAGAAADFLKMFKQVCDKLASEQNIDSPEAPVRIGKTYFRCELRCQEWRALVAEDEQRSLEASRGGSASQYRCIYRVWPDFPIKGAISQSIATIKADAALRSFEASGDRIVWAVIDSGIAQEHPHFGTLPEDHTLLHPTVKDLHRCFVPVPVPKGKLAVMRSLGDPDVQPPPEERDHLVDLHRYWALRDDYGHGTHVAGIIAGRAPEPGAGNKPVVVLQREDRMDAAQIESDDLARQKVTRKHELPAKEARRLHGVAQDCRLVSLRVLDEKGEGRSSDVIRALEYVRETLNDNPKIFRVQGVNLSVGYEFDAEMFACGQSPLCSEVNRLVQAGVVVVTAAGNTGYGTLSALTRATKVGLSNTINDPGNADLAITVGSTHRESPHTFGVSYFSSKGPTGDGRLKPDILAPGERIISCAAGQKRKAAEHELVHAAAPTPAVGTAAVLAPQPEVAPLGASAPAADPPGAAPGPPALAPAGDAVYVEDSGTSMAAPHVSGAIAAFLSIRREFIGRPLEVKAIFLKSAVPLGRERYFEGHGLLDLMKAIQSV